MALYIATRGASDPWTNVRVLPDRDISRAGMRELREVRAILRANAALLGERCALRAVVVDGRDVKGPTVAIVETKTGRIGKLFPASSLEASLALAVEAARAAHAKAVAHRERLNDPEYARRADDFDRIMGQGKYGGAA